MPGDLKQVLVNGPAEAVWVRLAQPRQLRMRPLVHRELYFIGSVGCLLLAHWTQRRRADGGGQGCYGPSADGVGGWLMGCEKAVRVAELKRCSAGAAGAGAVIDGKVQTSSRLEYTYNTLYIRRIYAVYGGFHIRHVYAVYPGRIYFWGGAISGFYFWVQVAQEPPVENVENGRFRAVSAIFSKFENARTFSLPTA